MKKSGPVLLLFILSLFLSTIVVQADDCSIILHRPPQDQLLVEELWSADVTMNIAKTVYLRAEVFRLDGGRRMISRAESNDFDFSVGTARIMSSDITDVRNEDLATF